MALGDAILACLTERPMTGYELAKTFDATFVKKAQETNK